MVTMAGISRPSPSLYCTTSLTCGLRSAAVLLAICVASFRGRAVPLLPSLLAVGERRRVQAQLPGLLPGHPLGALGSGGLGAVLALADVFLSLELEPGMER